MSAISYEQAVLDEVERRAFVALDPRLDELRAALAPLTRDASDAAGLSVRAVVRLAVSLGLKHGTDVLIEQRMLAPARRVGRRRLTDDRLREVARVHAADTSGAPVRAVAEHFGVARRTAMLYVARAREAGFFKGAAS